MKIRDLEPGQRFRYPELGKTAVLVSQGAMGARIKYDGRERAVEFTAHANDEDRAADVAFVSPGSVVIVSDYSDVEVIN